MNISKIIERFKKDATPTPQMLLCMDGMAERNAARMEAIKEQMGTLYILHPDHKKSKLDGPRPV